MSQKKKNTSCNTQSSAPEDGRECRPKQVQLIGIINKLLLLHLVGFFLLFMKHFLCNYILIKLIVSVPSLPSLCYSTDCNRLMRLQMKTKKKLIVFQETNTRFQAL